MNQNIESKGGLPTKWIYLIAGAAALIFVLFVAYAVVAAKLDENTKISVLSEKERQEQASGTELDLCLAKVDQDYENNIKLVASMYEQSQNPKWQEDCRAMKGEGAPISEELCTPMTMAVWREGNAHYESIAVAEREACHKRF